MPNAREFATLVGVATARSNTAKNIADKFQFEYCTCDANEILEDEKINTIFIATRHNLHGKYTLLALKKGKHVFVEKPLAISLSEFEEIQSLYSSIPNSELPKLMLGFNRRFSPLVLKVKELFGGSSPKAITYRINAGIVPADHWVQDPDIGGGRIIGEVCHFVDLVMHLAGAPVTKVSAYTMDTPENLCDTLTINLVFENGSIASIAYFSNGNKSLPKEYLETFYCEQVAVIEDFKNLTIYRGDAATNQKLKKQDKGHKTEIELFLNSIQKDLPTPVPEQDSFHVTRVVFKILESIRTNQSISF